jgi:hypothetical protein
VNFGVVESTHFLFQSAQSWFAQKINPQITIIFMTQYWSKSIKNAFNHTKSQRMNEGKKSILVGVFFVASQRLHQIP